MWMCPLCNTENADTANKCILCGTHRNLSEHDSTSAKLKKLKSITPKKASMNIDFPYLNKIINFYNSQIKSNLIISNNLIYFRDIVFGIAFYFIFYFVLKNYVPMPREQFNLYQNLMGRANLGMFYKFKLNFFMISFYMLPLFLHISLTNRDFINSHLLKYEKKKGIMVLVGFFAIPVIGGLLGLSNVEISIYNSMKYLSYIWCLIVIFFFLVDKFKYYMKLKNYQLFFFVFMFFAYVINPMFFSSITFTISNKLCEASEPKELSYNQKTEIKVNTELANIRDGPSMKHKVITTAKYGTVLEVLGKEQNWFHVSIPSQNCKKGYIHKNIVENFR